MPVKPNKESIVTDILAEIEFFGISYSDCLELNATKWKLPTSTFVRYWKIASARFREATERKNLALEDVRIEMEKERLKSSIMDKYERMEFLTKLATGEIPSWREAITENGVERLYYYSGAEAKAHIAELNKMEGDYAPIKKDITTGGDKLEAPVFKIVLDDGEL